MSIASNASPVLNRRCRMAGALARPTLVAAEGSELSNQTSGSEKETASVSLPTKRARQTPQF